MRVQSATAFFACYRQAAANFGHSHIHIWRVFHGLLVRLIDLLLFGFQGFNL
jgi:hypothetical protein